MARLIASRDGFVHECHDSYMSPSTTHLQQQADVESDPP